MIEISEAMVGALEVFHSHRFLHRDLIPGKIWRGLNEKGDLYLVDFGFQSCSQMDGPMNASRNTSRSLALRLTYPELRTGRSAMQGG